MGDNEAVAMARRPAREEGILGGFLAGANLAAGQVATRPVRGKTVVTLIPDTRLRDLSTDLSDALSRP